MSIDICQGVLGATMRHMNLQFPRGHKPNQKLISVVQGLPVHLNDWLDSIFFGHVIQPTVFPQ